MLEIEVAPREFFNQETQEFIKVGPNGDKPIKLKLEHSLISISKWESIFKKPFLDDKHEKTVEEIKAYIKCMSVDGDNITDSIVDGITTDQMKDILEYIGSQMTASTITNNAVKKGPQRHEILTSELIYYYMAAFHLPFYAEKWHLSRLLMLINIANAKEHTESMSKDEILKQNSAINKARLKAAKKPHIPKPRR